MTIEFRTAGPDDWDAVCAVDERAFGFTSTSDRKFERAAFEFDRTILGEQDHVPVALSSIFSLTMSVPGGALLPTAGVTWVGVQTTHRRQGALTAMMRRMVDDTRARGTEPLMALYATDPGIYGRFGYGIATQAVSVTVPNVRGRLAWAPEPEPGLRIRMVVPADVRQELAEISRRVAAHRAGGVVRTEPFWDLHLDDDPEHRYGGSAARGFLVEDDNGPRAFATYRTNITWEQPVAAGELRLRELGYVDPQAAALLWKTLLGHDLIGKVVAGNLPVDDPLLWLLGDPRSAQPTVKDAVHVRIVDVPAALEARTYAVPIDAVLDLHDAFAPWCTGRYRLTGGPDGATCTPTTDAGDVRLGASELGAIYLGGTRLTALADAGRVEELTPGAVRSTSLAFLADRAPWCPFVF